MPGAPMTEPRYTPLKNVHEALGASFTDFGGWMMPVRYTSDLAEHKAVREAAGLFDISHMSEFLLEGPGAAAFLDYALAGRISTMKLGKAKYSLLLDERGGIADDLIVYRLADERFLVIANAGNRAVVATALEQRKADFPSAVADAGAFDLDDMTDDVSLIAVQGPNARAILESLAELTVTGTALADLGYYAWSEGDFGDVPTFIARTGYTGEDGFELLVPNSAAETLWNALMQVGAEHGLVPAGLAARDTLRLEAGMPLYGHELSLETAPAQAGLGRVVAADKDVFVGKDGLDARDLTNAPVLVGLAAEGRRAARAEYDVYQGDEKVGTITSGALSPTLGYPIALAMVAPSASAIDTELHLDVRGTRIPATVINLPFYRRNS